MDKITTIKFRRDLLIALAEDIIRDTKNTYPYTKGCEDNVKYYEDSIKQTNEDFEKGSYGRISMWYNGTINDISDDFDFLLSHRQQFLDKYDFDLLDLNKKRREKIEKIVASGKIKTAGSSVPAKLFWTSLNLPLMTLPERPMKKCIGI